MKRLLIPIIIIALTATFLIISFLVIVTKGNPALIKRKLKLGALLLTFTLTQTGCDGLVTQTCYAPIPSEQIVFTDVQTDTSGIIIDLTKSQILKGTISYRTSNEFSYKIADSGNVIIQNGNISAYDGKFDSSTEPFEIKFNSNFKLGVYDIYFYKFSKEKQDSLPNSYIGRNKFKIIKL